MSYLKLRVDYLDGTLDFFDCTEFEVDTNTNQLIISDKKYDANYKQFILLTNVKKYSISTKPDY